MPFWKCIFIVRLRVVWRACLEDKFFIGPLIHNVLVYVCLYVSYSCTTLSCLVSFVCEHISKLFCIYYISQNKSLNYLCLSLNKSKNNWTVLLFILKPIITLTAMDHWSFLCLAEFVNFVYECSLD